MIQIGTNDSALTDLWLALYALTKFDQRLWAISMGSGTFNISLF